jgi:hypothetical protein
MIRLALLAVLALSACTDPRLSTTMVIGNGGVAISPTLSGTVGDATVSLAAN